MRLRFTPSWQGFVLTYLVTMNGLAAVNLLLAGRRVSTLLLLPLAGVSAGMAAVYIKRLYVATAPRLSGIDLLVMAYLGYALVSGLFYLQPDNPSSALAYAYGLNVQVLPMLMYFAAHCMARAGDTRVVTAVVVLQAFCAAVGLTLYLTRPDFYSDYLTDLLGKSEDWAIYARLQSYWGSTGVGILSATSIALLPVTGLQRQMRYFLLFLFLATILLAQQRGAYISGVAAAAYFIYRERVSWTYLLLGVLGMTAVGVLVLAKSGVTTDMVIAIIDNRVVFDLFEGDPYGERSVSWAKGLDFLMRFPLGLGLGATTSAATDAGAHVDGQVVDAYYMRVASDLGVAGLALFVLLLAVAFTTAIRNRATWAYAVIVFIFAFQSTGTNVLDSYYVAHVFWMLLGFLSVRSVRDCVVAGIGAPSVRSAY